MYPKVERDSMTYFAVAGPDMSGPRPKRFSGVGLTNFIKRERIQGFGRDGAARELLYRIKAAGLKAYLASKNSD